ATPPKQGSSPPAGTMRLFEHPRHHSRKVRATRKPISACLSVVTSQVRLADRKSFGSSAHEPPRTTWPEQSPVVRAVPSCGSPERFAFQQSSTHSRTLPCTWRRPNGLGAEASVATVRRVACALALPL